MIAPICRSFDSTAFRLSERTRQMFLKTSQMVLTSYCKIVADIKNFCFEGKYSLTYIKDHSRQAALYVGGSV